MCVLRLLFANSILPNPLFAEDAAKTIGDQALHGWAGGAERLRGAGASVQRVSPAMGSLQMENLRLKPHRIGKTTSET